MFKQLIEQQNHVATSVYERVQEIQLEGYTIDLDVSINDGNLFFHADQHERILLMRDQDKWIGKQEEVMLTTEELIKKAEASTERLSNNVVTRPLMQEYLFPTLAFMAGDGEINYWMALKKAFHLFNFK